MKFNETKFGQLTHDERIEVSTEPYKTASGEEIEVKSIVKDLGVPASDDQLFRDNMDKITLSCR